MNEFERLQLAVLAVLAKEQVSNLSDIQLASMLGVQPSRMLNNEAVSGLTIGMLNDLETLIDSIQPFSSSDAQQVAEANRLIAEIESRPAVQPSSSSDARIYSLTDTTRSLAEALFTDMQAQAFSLPDGQTVSRLEPQQFAPSDSQTVSNPASQQASKPAS
jgi:hypothetical protein